MPILLITILVMLMLASGDANPVVNFATFSDECYPCEKLRRTWKSNLCRNDISDCGDCINGFIPSPSNSSDVCEFFGTIHSQQAAVVPQGSNVILVCQSDMEILDCAWQRGGFEISVNDRYHYFNRNLTESQDCSIEIYDFQHFDAAEWRCNIYSKHYSANDPVQTKSYWMSLYDGNAIYAREGQVVRVPFGKTVILAHCDKLGRTCQWRRNKAVVDVSYRDKYIHVMRNGADSEFCSLRITTFLEEDVGNWQCHSRSTNRMGFQLQPVLPALQIVEGPKNHTSRLGDEITLPCKFNYDVNCVWEKNGKPLKIGGTYGFIGSDDGKMTKDCSISIKQLASSDPGVWKCGHEAHKMSNELIFSSASIMVKPQIDLTQIMPSSKETRRFICSATNGYPPAEIYWLLNESKQQKYNLNIDAETKLSNSSSEIEVHSDDVDALKCVVAHATFTEPQNLYAKEAKPFIVEMKHQPEDEINIFMLSEKRKGLVFIALIVVSLSLAAIALTLYWRERKRVRNMKKPFKSECQQDEWFINDGYHEQMQGGKLIKSREWMSGHHMQEVNLQME